jgi:hypothetical protein
MLGQWSNVNAETRGTIRVAIAKKDGAWTIEMWGKAIPQAIPTGISALHLLGPDVGAKALDYGFASWDFKFKAMHVAVHLEGDRLVVESYNIFQDKSGRSNYRSREVFKRAE